MINSRASKSTLDLLLADGQDSTTFFLLFFYYSLNTRLFRVNRAFDQIEIVVEM